MSASAQDEGAVEVRPTDSSDGAVALRNAIKLGSSLLATWTVALVVRFQLPRYLGPARFGEFNFSESFAAAFFVFIGLGIDTYIQKEIAVRPKSASEFFGGVLALRATLALLLFGVMATTLHLTGRSDYVDLVLIFGLTQFVVGLNGSFAAMLQASTNVGALAVQNVVSKLLWGVGVALGIWCRMPLAVLAAPMLVSEVIKAAVLFRAVRKEIGLELRLDLRALQVVTLASMPFYVNSIAINLSNRIDVAMLEFLGPKPEVGWYGAASNFASLAMLLGPLLTWVLMPLLARAHHRSEEEFFAIFRRALEGVLVVAIPVTLVIALGADFWVRVAFGAPFAPSAVSLRFLAPIFIATYTAMLTSIALIILNRSWRLTIVSTIGVMLQPLMILAFVPLLKHLGPGGYGAGVAVGVSGMELFVTIVFIVNLGRRVFDRRNVFAIGMSLGVFAAVVALDRLLAGAGIGSVRLIADVFSYVVLAFVTRAVKVSDVVGGVQLILAGRRAKSAA